MSRQDAAVGVAPGPVARPSVLTRVLAVAAGLGTLLFVVLSPRGFDFTDESYYVLNYLHWQAFGSAVTFFGAVFEWPYRMLGQSLAAIRVFGFVLLAACAVMLAGQWVRWLDHVADRPGGTPPADRVALLLAAACAASAYYSHLTSLRAPSYNLLALAAALAATAMILRLATIDAGRRTLGVTGLLLALAFGAALTLASLAKPTAGIVMALLHLGVVASAPPAWRRRVLGPVVAGALAGTVLVLGALHLGHPDWWASVQRGRMLLSETDARGVRFLLDHLRWDLQRVLRDFGLGAVLVGVACVWVHRAPGVAAARAPFVVGLATASALAVLGVLPPQLWWPLVALTAACTLVHAADRLGRPALRRTALVLAALVLAPLGLSFGTNMPVLEHSRLFAPLALIGLMGLVGHLAASVGGARRIGLQVTLGVLALPWLLFHLRPAFDDEQAYRQRTALLAQTVPVPPGPGSRGPLRVDAATASDIASVRAAAARAGFQAGMPLLDLTGDGPGWVVLLGGAPVGVPWLLGGYEGSERAAQRLLAGLPAATLRAAWLLTSPDGQRSLPGAVDRVGAHAGVGAHERVAEVIVHPTYAWRTPAPETVTLQLWRPTMRPDSP